MIFNAYHQISPNYRCIFFLIRIILNSIYHFNYIFIIKEANNVSSILKIPMWPFVALVTFGFVLFCIVLFVQFLEYIVEGSEKK